MCIRDSADGPVWVAGSMSPVEDCFSPWLVPEDDALRREHAMLAGWLVAAGVDLILVETMNLSLIHISEPTRPY